MRFFTKHLIPILVASFPLLTACNETWTQNPTTGPHHEVSVFGAKRLLPTAAGAPRTAAAGDTATLPESIARSGQQANGATTVVSVMAQESLPLATFEPATLSPATSFGIVPPSTDYMLKAQYGSGQAH